MMMDSPFIESSYIWQAAMRLSVVSLPVASMNPQMQSNCAARVISFFAVRRRCSKRLLASVTKCTFGAGLLLLLFFGIAGLAWSLGSRNVQGGWQVDLS